MRTVTAKMCKNSGGWAGHLVFPLFFPVQSSADLVGYRIGAVRTIFICVVRRLSMFYKAGNVRLAFV